RTPPLASSLFPYTTLFRSAHCATAQGRDRGGDLRRGVRKMQGLRRSSDRRRAPHSVVSSQEHRPRPGTGRDGASDTTRRRTDEHAVDGARIDGRRGAVLVVGSGQRAAGPRRELSQSVPLFPLRPLGLGEVLGAAVRIYRLRARSVLGVAAVVYGIAFVALTVFSGASMVPMFGEMQAAMTSPEAAETAEAFTSVRDVVLMLLSTAATMIITMLASSLVTVALTRVALGEATGRRVSGAQMWETMRRRGAAAIAVSLLIGLLSTVALAVLGALGALPLLLIQEASWLTIVPLVLGVVLGILAIFW